MGIDADTAKKIIRDVQVSHRLVVGFYQRIIPLIDHISSEMNFEFYYWKPHTSRPAVGTTQPSKNWLWDMVPLYASQHTYQRVKGGGLDSADRALVFDLYVDEGFRSALRQNEPDATEFERGDATLYVDIYRATRSSELTFEDVWNKAKSAKREEQDWHHVHDHMEARSFAVPLEQLICDHESTANRIRSLLGDPEHQATA